MITDGFSCREMMEQNEDVRPLNLAEFLWRAMQESGWWKGGGPKPA